MDTERRPVAEGAGGPPQLAALPDEPFYREPARGEQSRRWGSILLVLGVVWLVFAIGSRGSLFGLGLGLVERSAALPAQSFTATRVVVSGFNDDIELVGWGEGEIQLEGERHGFGWNGGAAEDALEGVEVLATQSGDTLTIEVRRPGSLGRIVGRGPYADLRISIPAGVAVEASTASGELVAEGLRGDLSLGTVSGQIESDGTAGALAISTTSGDADVRDHRGPLTVSSVSGEIRAGGDLADPQVETVSGDVVLEGVRGDVTVSSISGDIAIDAARDARLNLESTSGDISVDGGLAADAESAISNISGDVTLMLPADAGLRLDASTVSGDLSADLPLRDLVEERRRLSGRIGDGAAALTISTTSGDVTLEGE
jgi:DUF4097 and DUF4098 domain-containing protein YvlB